MDDRTFVLISIPNNFVEKFVGLINNLNMLNEHASKFPVKIEKVYKMASANYAAIPKDDGNEN